MKLDGFLIAPSYVPNEVRIMCLVSNEMKGNILGSRRYMYINIMVGKFYGLWADIDQDYDGI